MRPVIGFVLALVGAVAPTMEGRLVSAEPLEAAADRYVKPLQELEVFDGVILIARDGRILLSKAYGLANVELRVANTPAQRFRIASLSKLFTAVAIGRLWEQGALDLHTPVSHFLPEFPRGDSISVEQLLDHRAGVPNINDLPYIEDAVEPNSLDDLIRHIEKQPLDFTPGSQTRYSNGNYAVLAKIIERASGKRYEDYLRDEVLVPLGLKDTGHESDGFLLEHRAYGYRPNRLQRHGLIPAPFQQMATKTGGGSLYSTAGDLYRFGQALFRDNVIKRATYETILHADDRTLMQTGRCPGFNVLLLRRLEDDVTVVVLSNNYASGMLADVGRDFATLALGGSATPPRYRSDVELPEASLGRLAGRYRDTGGAMPFLEGRMLDVRLEGDHLTAYAGEKPLDVLIPQTDHTFLMRNLWSELTFDQTANTLVYRPLFRSGEYTLTRAESR